MSFIESEDGKVNPVVFVIAWAWVIALFGYGLFFLLQKIPALFV